MGGRLDPSVADVRRAVRDECADLDPGTSVVVASSGGADSLVLAAAAVFEGRRAGWLVSAATVDHAVQSGSDTVAESAAAALRGLGCDPVHVLRVDVGTAGGPEAAARGARYRALEELATETGSQSSTVLLGHTRDDQAETVLLGLARGSGTRSLAGMPRRRGLFRRPLLDLPRATVRAAAEQLGLAPWDDPQNEDPRFARARVRHAVLPLLERELGPGFGDALARTAGLARDDADALDAWAADAHASAETAPGTLSVAVLGSLPPAIRSRVVRLAALAAGAPATDVSAGHVGSVCDLLDDWHGQRAIALPGRVAVRRSGDHLRFEQAPEG